jgi:serine/threonine protein kinase
MKKYKCDLFTEIEYLYPARNPGRPQVIPPGRIIRYTKQILECLIRLHSLGFAHLDVKSENIFLDENDHVVLGDFGLSSPIFVYSTVRGRGTKDWQSPEMIDPSLPIDFAKVDIWSLGMTIVEMMRGIALVHPGGQACRVAYCRSIPTLVQRLSYPANLIKFTQSLFEFDISKRPTAKQALQMMYDFQLLSPAVQNN